MNNPLFLCGPACCGTNVVKAILGVHPKINAEDMKKGDVLNEKNLRIVRPGLGLEPKYYEILLGRKVNRDVKKGKAMTWKIII